MKELINNLTAKQITMFVIGVVFMGLGIALYINTDVGLGAWDVLHNNLFEFYGLTVGTWVTIVGIITITFSQLFYPNILSYLSAFTGLLLGFFLDRWMELIYISGLFDGMNITLRWLIFFGSLIFLGSGIALLVLSKLPPTPIDVLMISYMKRFHLNFNIAKFLTEFTAFVCAIIVGTINNKPFNNVALGTLIAVFGIGYIVQVSTKVWERLFHVHKDLDEDLEIVD